MIHFAWYVPTKPNEISLNILTYGYEIFRSDTNLNILNLRQGIPARLTNINDDIPILVSGNPAQKGPHSFLAIDHGNIFEGEYLTRGDIFYYYIVARDIYGKFSETAGPLVAQVPDRQPPVMPWGLHTEREEEYTGGLGTTPRLSLIWDQINPDNYIQTYCSDSEICPQSTPTQICYAKTGTACSIKGKPVCFDLDVKQYHIYRFTSPEDASVWGPDNDGDKWPDSKEDLIEDGVVDVGETDPCDSASHPPGTPPELVAIIGQNAMNNTRTLQPSGKIVQFFRDPFITDNNKVYWYKIQAEDFNGNCSPLSPPVRAVLFDRSQPMVNAWLRRRKCYYTARFLNIEECDDPDADDAFLTLIDLTQDAAEYAIYKHCAVPGIPIETTTLLEQGAIEGLTFFNVLDIRECNELYQCTIIIRFYNEQGRFLAEASFILKDDECNPAGCIILEKVCRYEDVEPGVVLPPKGPVQIMVHLKPGECARIYHLIAGKYSPFDGFCTDANDCGDADPNTFCYNPVIPPDGCLGLRIFSKNHVGSILYRFPCITLDLGAPQRPLIESVRCDCTSGNEGLMIRWAAQGYGLAAFIVALKNNEGVIYKVTTDVEPDPNTGQFDFKYGLSNPNDLNKEWCVRVRALNTALAMSEWSSEVCEMCCEEIPGHYLPWPPVTLPPSGPDVTGFYLKGPDVLALVLSDDLSDNLDYLEKRECTIDIPICNKPTDSNCISDVLTEFGCRGVCDLLHRSNKLGKFILYRQEENKNFVQVSPSIETFFCKTWPDPYDSYYERLVDPFIYLVSLPVSTVIAGVEPQIKSSLAGTTRLLYIDKYPFVTNTKVRYKIIRMSGTNENPDESLKIIDTRFSNWIEILN